MSQSRGNGVINNRWVQLGLGIVCMTMIANLQYGWTLFVLPIDADHRWGKSAIQLAFTLFILCETWPLALLGRASDRFGPRAGVATGGVLIGLSWTVYSLAETITTLYVGAILGGIGAGLIYAATVGNAVKWFPDRRGLAAGLTAAGFGAGSALTIIPIGNWIASHGYRSAFLTFGAGQAAVVLLVAAFLARPPALARGGMGLGPRQVLGEPAFWVMYAMFVMVGAGGLMATAQLSVIATDFGVAASPVSVLGWTLPALTLALSLDRVLNGFTRPFFGWVSDRIGRELTMLIAFTLEGLGILALIAFAHSPIAFVLISGLVFFAWGEIYSLFPATTADLFGSRHASVNYGLLYTAKGTAALLVPYGNMIREASGSWETVFYVAAALNLTAGCLAWFALRPLRMQIMAARQESALVPDVR